MKLAASDTREHKLKIAVCVFRSTEFTLDIQRGHPQAPPHLVSTDLVDRTLQPVLPHSEM